MQVDRRLEHANADAAATAKGDEACGFDHNVVEDHIAAARTRANCILSCFLLCCLETRERVNVDNDDDDDVDGAAKKPFGEAKERKRRRSKAAFTFSLLALWTKLNFSQAIRRRRSDAKSKPCPTLETDALLKRSTALVEWFSAL